MLSIYVVPQTVAWPSHMTVELLTKPAPLTVNQKLSPPAGAELGLRLVKDNAVVVP